MYPSSRRANLGLDPTGGPLVHRKLVVKLLRALGGCLGARRRRRTWLAAISCAEPQAGVDTQMSEWGNPLRVMSEKPFPESIGKRRPTGGIETSQYPEEKKSNQRFRK